MLFQQACDNENMSAKFGQTLSSLENRVRRFILTRAPILGRLPFITEVKQHFTQISERKITIILSKLDKLDVIHLTNEQTAISAAYPFSGKTTHHSVIFKDQPFKPLYAMCAIDALGVGFMFKCDVVIESKCNHCNEKIEVGIENYEIVSLKPKNLVVWGDMEYSHCAATSVCKNINFFSSEDHFDRWCEKFPTRNGTLLQIQEAFYLGKLFFENRL
jgi:hypothetical protein